MKFKVLFIVAVSTLLIACNKIETGPQKPDFEIDNFERLKVQGGVDVEFFQGALKNEVIATTLDENDFHDQGDLLFIQESYGVVNIAVANLDYIYGQGADYEMNEQVTFQNLEMDLYSSDVRFQNLNVLDTLDLYLTGNSTYKFGGNVRFADINNNSGAYFQGYDLVCDTMEITITTNNAEVNVTSFLKVNMAGGGNLIYKGNPDSVLVVGFGTGSVTPY